MEQTQNTGSFRV